MIRENVARMREERYVQDFVGGDLRERDILEDVHIDG